MLGKNEQAHPFYKPLWRRWLVVILTVIWAGFEWFAAKDPFWGILATGLAAYAFWVLIYTFPKDTEAPKNPEIG